ncbi:TerC family protein [Rapidithrix thailandica]|uniref:TerC family protein n=1 Tax=Rapidithrix thailandica TaxID=413964 RepID=A0AAW9RWP6_9BACT
MEVLFTSAGLISLLTLTALEIVLGIDNVIFISIVSNKLPAHQKDKARTLGILIALVVRVALLFGITWIIGLKEPLFSLGFLEGLNMDPHFSGRDLILLGGGLFLIAKSTAEIHDKLEGHEEGGAAKTVGLTLWKAIVQIVLIDIVFSFDSILTAVGLVQEILIMIIAVVIALIVMLVFSKGIADFVENHPTIKMLALSFLVLIGFLLVVEAFDVHVPKGYIYFSMAFALLVELLNLRMRKKTIKTQLTHPETEKVKVDQ